MRQADIDLVQSGVWSDLGDPVEVYGRGADVEADDPDWRGNAVRLVPNDEDVPAEARFGRTAAIRGFAFLESDAPALAQGAIIVHSGTEFVVDEIGGAQAGTIRATVYPL